MSKHTPGPWVWTDRYASSTGDRTFSLIGQGGYGILSCDGEGNSPQGCGDYANASLIAAAPMLLECTKTLMHFLQGLHATNGSLSDSQHDMLDAARAAIAAATGDA